MWDGLERAVLEAIQLKGHWWIEWGNLSQASGLGDEGKELLFKKYLGFRMK